MISKKSAWLWMIAWLWIGGAVWAQDLPASGKAETILKNFADLLQAQNRFSVHVLKRVESRQTWGQVVQQDSYQLAVDRDGRRFAMVYQKGLGGASVVCDGKEVTSYVPYLNQVQKEKAPAVLEGLVAEGADAAGTLISTIPLIEAFLDSKQAYGKMLRDVSKVSYVGRQDEWDVVQLDQPDFSWKGWLQAQGQGLLGRIEVEVKQGENINRYVWIYQDWKLQEPPEAEWFTLSLPEDAREVLYFGSADPHPMVGTQPRAIAGELVNGQTMSLENHVGKDIVVVDFWAIRCPPCRASLPEYSKIAQMFKDKGVVFYTINSEDKPEAIRTFFRENQIDLNVLLDQTGQFAGAYQVRGIPFTVVIGKNGLVQSVHQGYGPQVKEQLTKELQALLEGKDLAGMARGPKMNEIEDIDLACGEVAFTPEPIQPGKNMSLAWKITNQGATTVRGHRCTISLTVNSQPVLMGVLDADIGPDQTIVFSPSENIWKIEFTKPQTCYYQAIVDLYSQISETNKTNNFKIGSWQVQ